MNTTSQALADQVAEIYDDDTAPLVIAVLGGAEPFRLFAASDNGDVHDRLWDLLEQAQDIARGDDKLTAAVAELVDWFWPPVTAEDVFDIAGLYGVDEDTDPLDLAVAQ